ncbi:hypothetical protein Acr_00g0086680 [Actinidia rufa]|uniref:Uncharacterized protein n=1 Tax=Actinidia rufa TaxID=165716 RepID=A0A7J0DVT7_9ERIC|nr:hypothetical protein Acr_00g0086680 [Actinidia rufa]
MKRKMKRKDLEEVNDEFSQFSLSSPARKIRRLDAELPPIMEEKEPKVPLVFEQLGVSDEHLPSHMEFRGSSGPVIEELPTESENEERAIVLFKDVNTPLLRSPSNLSVTVNSDLFSGIKNQIFWTSQYNAAKSAEDEATRPASNNRATNGCLAVVPWIPSQFPQTSGTEAPQTEVSELMESEDMGATTMDIEENDVSEPGQERQFVGMNEGFHQWQQHCVIPQRPQNTATPIVWYR